MAIETFCTFQPSRQREVILRRFSHPPSLPAMKIAEMLTTLRCFSSAPSICFNHMVTENTQTILQFTKHSRLKNISVSNKLCGRQQCHRAPGKQAKGALGATATGFQPGRVSSSRGGGSRCQVLGWESPVLGQPEMLHRKKNHFLSPPILLFELLFNSGRPSPSLWALLDLIISIFLRSALN